MTERGAILVIGYGNTQRGDDGIGPRVAAAITAAHLPGVRVVTLFQLVPELAADLAESRLAVFVDAVADPTRSDIELRPIAPAETTGWSTHSADPRVLLALTQAVYGPVPAAWWAIVPGRYFGLGEQLSPLAEEGIRQAVDRIETLIRPYLQ